MQPETQPAHTSKIMFWSGWVVSILPVLALIMSGVMKVLMAAPVLKEFARLGYPAGMPLPIGIVELVCVVLYAIPRTSVLGAILLTGYLGGAVATHVRLAEDFSPPVIMGVMVWLGLFLRDARIRALIPLRN